MHTLVVNCVQCDSVNEFFWCFNNEIVLCCLGCKECSSSYQLQLCTQKQENVITGADFLPCTNHIYYDAFYYNESDGNFYYYHLPENEVSLPILILNQTIGYKQTGGNSFEKDEDGLVKFSDIEEYLNKYVK